MNYIFLDIDGVLNNYAHHIHMKKTSILGSIEFMKNNIDPWNIRNLKYISANIDLRIIISSTWRKYYNVEDFNKYFSLCGIENLVIGTTILRLSSNFDTRANEISIWVADHNIPKDKYVVLDDHCIYSKKHSGFDRFYQTNADNGLTYTDACNVIEKLNPKWERPIFFL